MDSLQSEISKVVASAQGGKDFALHSCAGATISLGKGRKPRVLVIFRYGASDKIMEQIHSIVGDVGVALWSYYCVKGEWGGPEPRSLRILVRNTLVVGDDTKTHITSETEVNLPWAEWCCRAISILNPGLLVFVGWMDDLKNLPLRPQKDHRKFGRVYKPIILDRMPSKGNLSFDDYFHAWKVKFKSEWDAKVAGELKDRYHVGAETLRDTGKKDAFAIMLHASKRGAPASKDEGEPKNKLPKVE